jgi:hypothetical protein
MIVGYSTIPYAIARRHTAKAILFNVGMMSIWIPRSQLHNIHSRVQPGYAGRIDVSNWWLNTSGNDRLRAPHRESHSSNDSSSDAYSHSDSQIAGPSEATRKVYRRIIAKYHPDRSPETAEMAKDINELWQSFISGK